MALQSNPLYTETTRGPLPRIQPDNGPGAIRTVQIAAGGAVTYPAGTMFYIAVATGLATLIVPTAAIGATNVIDCVLLSPITFTGAGEIIAPVMVRGAIHFDEVEALRVAGVYGGATAAQMRDVCRQPDVRRRGIVIEGLTKLDTTTTGLSA